mmetsp:Transcript_26162/g.52129  ORF Transcript_26162/g.52129 Transcript_26162/m.52129 type:complete len:86 (-) Transcript_26162:250-507(-)
MSVDYEQELFSCSVQISVAHETTHVNVQLNGRCRSKIYGLICNTVMFLLENKSNMKSSNFSHADKFIFRQRLFDKCRVFCIIFSI